MDYGILLVAYNKEYYLDAAILCAKSIKECMPLISISLCTENIFLEKARKCGIFEKVIIIENSSFLYLPKIDGISKTPYKYTIFIDADSYVGDCLNDLFSTIEDQPYKFAAHFSFWKKTKINNGISSSILCYGSDDETKNIIQKWREEYLRYIDLVKINEIGDQSFLSYVMYINKIPYYILGDEIHVPYYLSSCMNGKIRSVTGKNHDMCKNMHRFFNISENRRLYNAYNKTLYISNEKWGETFSGFTEVKFEDWILENSLGKN